MNENILILHEMGMISSADEREALDFCKKSKIGEYKCSVKTRYGWFCDLCLEEELLKLRLDGVYAAGSCCGHGDIAKASILTVGEDDERKMLKMGYIKADNIERISHIGQPIYSWVPKSVLIYQNEEDNHG